jgi:hypothetical protein
MPVVRPARHTDDDVSRNPEPIEDRSMNQRIPPSRHSWGRSPHITATVATALVALLATPMAAQAGAIPVDTYLQFGFEQAGTAAVGCDPADPGGLFCIPSSGTATSFLDAPAWTFSGAGFVLTVVDAFLSDAQFEVFDFGVLVGVTSLPARLGVDCGDDPVTCLATAGMSQGVFALGAGNHALTLVPTRAAGPGSAYLHLAAVPNTVPEPTSLALALGALGLMCGKRRRKNAVDIPALVNTGFITPGSTT